MTSTRISKLKKKDFGKLQILVGWKKIAAHIGVTPRTMQKWVHKNGFPKISLNPDSPKSIVAVEKNLLTIWINSLTTQAKNKK